MVFLCPTTSLAPRVLSFDNHSDSTTSTMYTAQLPHQIQAIAKPTMYLLFSILTFYVAVTCYYRSTTAKIILHIILMVFAWLSFTNMVDLVPPLDTMWGLMMAVWISHSASLLWIEKILLESILNNRDCARNLFCCCRSHTLLKSLWYDCRSLRRSS
jgi:hypothetical protein